MESKIQESKETVEGTMEELFHGAVALLALSVSFVQLSFICHMTFDCCCV